MIRILHIITTLEHGGAEKNLISISSNLDKNEFNQSIISLTTSSKKYSDIAELNNVQLINLNINNFITALVGIYKICKFLNQYKPHIVQTWLYHADILGLIIKILYKKYKVIWNIRCSHLAVSDISYTTRIIRYILSVRSQKVDGIIFNSKAGLVEHRKLGMFNENSHIIPNGFNLEEFKADKKIREKIREGLQINQDVFVCGMVARYDPLKNHDHFIRAAALLNKIYGKKIIFLLIGVNINWNNKKLVNSINHENLKDKFHLLGQRNDINDILKIIDCLVLTSITEGFPNVIGEAMASEVPCVSTCVGDVVSIMGNRKNIIKINDVADLVSKVNDIINLSTDEKLELGVNLRKRIENNFSIVSTMKKYRMMYSNV
ncbi:MAG: hypothetical protein CMM02_05590 [Rhodopirellula sp.]|nr:hypothetical protein [Rhodopirellula sp.]|tara:strand:+ start:25204 stop:26331 length:1128 start_codon:yes stop_codon:yes gene_type:complete